ncbi:hypothetical protein M758_1G286300 [Ceratodon purpureus]|uniref:Uncharacterized protein n=1 Tax=Ceratodon purpureus TaxID=3225 RepID=A0A8T0JAQ2_CERPU|nr:hypothetical protein KC19_1G294700 [Ceratodon purpureus]KAG0631880.1 hypothetical protein M758_1G286300 [Ceratodon purpureus]
MFKISSQVLCFFKAVKVEGFRSMKCDINVRRFCNMHTSTAQCREDACVTLVS